MRNEKLSARRFTTSAIHIVEQLWPRVADRSMSTDVTEQTIPMLALWSVLRWERKVGLVAVERMGVEVDALARDVDRALDAACAEIRRQNGPPQLQTLPSGQRGIVVDSQAPLAPLLDAAEHEARGLGHEHKTRTPLWAGGLGPGHGRSIGTGNYAPPARPAERTDDS